MPHTLNQRIMLHNLCKYHINTTFNTVETDLMVYPIDTDLRGITQETAKHETVGSEPTLSC